MAANKFATMVHKNTNKLTVILVYVVLEWALIAMLLLNALLSYLILRFSQFFGLEPPCIFCSRIDHVFDPKRKKNSQLDLLCKAHVSEISKLGFCSGDQKLGDLIKFCENCSKTQTEKENVEMDTNYSNFSNTQNGSLIFEVDPIDGSVKFEEIKLKYSVSEINLGMTAKEVTEGGELNLCTVIEDQSWSEKRIADKIEEGDDHNCDKFAVFESLEIKENEYNSWFFPTENNDFVSEQKDSVSLTGEAYQMPLNESEQDVSIGTDIPDIESTDDLHHQETHVKEDDHGIKQVEDDEIDLKTMSLDGNNHQSTLGLELDNLVEEKIPDMPSSIKSFHHLYNGLLLHEKKELVAEESFDGSVVSEYEVGGVTSIEQLISALRTERKALNDLYVELEEERSANAIAANQTMAMINRLQEEKSAIQMEASHFQRMVEEQSQYDQEALEFLDGLLMKREREKQELENELDVYRKKVLEYEEKRNLKVTENGSDSPSFSSSNRGDSYGSLVDLNQEDRRGESSDEENRGQTKPVNVIKFAEERFLILQQLKLLEHELFTLADDDDEKTEEDFEVVKPTSHIDEQNGNYMEKQNGIANGFTMEKNGKHEVGRQIMGMKGKRLLPLFHAVENGHSNGFVSDRLQNYISESREYENRNLDIEEELDHLYERLQALEADKEFLKHCICSLRKGDKGVGLLQEISRNLRHLRQ